MFKSSSSDRGADDEEKRMLDKVFFDPYFVFVSDAEARKRKHNLKKHDDRIEVEIEVPGFKKEEIKVRVTSDSVLVVEMCKESSVERWCRDLNLNEIDVEKIAAKLDLGLLTITIPYSGLRKPRIIEVT